MPPLTFDELFYLGVDWKILDSTVHLLQWSFFFPLIFSLLPLSPSAFRLFSSDPCKIFFYYVLVFFCLIRQPSYIAELFRFIPSFTSFVRDNWSDFELRAEEKKEKNFCIFFFAFSFSFPKYFMKILNVIFHFKNNFNFAHILLTFKNYTVLPLSASNTVFFFITSV